MKQRARIVGAGLIGTSIALKLAELGWEVDIDDIDPRAKTLASDLLGSSLGRGAPSLVIVATPINQRAGALQEEFRRNPECMFIDVGSVMSNLVNEVDGISGLSSRFIATHPIAGREFSGAQSARSDLFVSRAWVIAPRPENNPEDVERITELIASLGATPYLMSAESHDSLLSKISHLPQVLSTALARSLLEMGSEIELAGQGLRDLLRLAASSGDLWSEILIANGGEVEKAIDRTMENLATLRGFIERKEVANIREFFADANRVHSILGGKHGARAREYEYLNVVIEDKPGQLGALFQECAIVSANVEDISLEHSPRQETGLIRLALSKKDADILFAHLIDNHWKVHKG